MSVAVAVVVVATRLDTNLKARKERGREMARKINSNNKNKNRNRIYSAAEIFEIERAEREAKAKIASVKAWEAEVARVEATGKALDAWEASIGKRGKVRISQWLV